MTRGIASTVGSFIVVGVLASGCARTPVLPARAMPVAAPAAAPADSGYGLRGATVDYLNAADASGMALPADARPGDCYVRALVPTQYETIKERVLKKASAMRIDVTPAQFQDVEERVMVRPATKRLEVLPPTFEEVEERHLVTPATKRLEVVPATYRTVTEQHVMRPAYSVWKRSSELTAAERAKQKIDPAAGDILCLVEVAAETKTVTSEVVATPAATREVEVAAEYATVKKTVLKTPAITREVEVPAEYRTMTVKKMVAPAREAKTEIPAEYDEVSRQVVRTPAKNEWREVLCETNATQKTLIALQQSLKRAGFDPGREDGRVDPQTMNAVRAFQQSKGLPVDDDRYINVATVKALGVTP